MSRTGAPLFSASATAGTDAVAICLSQKPVLTLRPPQALRVTHIPGVVRNRAKRSYARAGLLYGTGSVGIARATANATPVAGVGRRAKKSDAPRPEILAPELSTWVGQLAALEQSETEDYAPELRQRLIYVVSLNRQHFGAPHLAVQPTSVKLLKDDTFSVTVKPFNPGNVAQDSPAKFLRPSDRDIFGKLTRMRHRVQADTGSLLAGEEGAAALKAMIATGRARWGSIHGAVVTQGPARRGRMAWRVNDYGWHQPAFELDEALDAEVIRLAPPWYVVPATAIVGPVETDYPPRIADAILSAPRVSVRQATLLRSEMQRRLRGLPIAEPPVAETLEQIKESPVPGLRLTVGDSWARPFYGYGRKVDTDERARLAQLFFRYGGIEIGAKDERRYPVFGRNGQLFEVARDDRAERTALAELMKLGFEKLPSHRLYEVGTQHRDDFVLRSDSTERWRMPDLPSI